MRCCRALKSLSKTLQALLQLVRVAVVVALHLSLSTPLYFALCVYNTQRPLCYLCCGASWHGLLVAVGPKHTTAVVLPHQSAVLVWQMVAYSSGYLHLPNIELISLQHSLQSSPCHARQVYVLPAKLPNTKQPQAQLGDALRVPMSNVSNSLSQLTMDQPHLVL